MFLKKFNLMMKRWNDNKKTFICVEIIIFYFQLCNILTLCGYKYFI